MREKLLFRPFKDIPGTINFRGVILPEFQLVTESIDSVDNILEELYDEAIRLREGCMHIKIFSMMTFINENLLKQLPIGKTIYINEPFPNCRFVINRLSENFFEGFLEETI